MQLAIAAFAVGSTMQVLGGIKDSQAQVAAAKANSKIARDNAAQIASQTDSQVEKQSRLAAIRQGAAFARASANGRGTTASLDLLSDNAAQEELDILTIKHNSLLNQSSILGSASLAQSAAKNGAKTMPYSVAGSVLSGASQFGTALSGSFRSNDQFSQ